MFRLTKQEQLVVVFLAGMLLLGTAVKHWRTLHPAQQQSNVVTREH
jgi:hypothetical protein